jgi:hypothetical protein
VGVAGLATELAIKLQVPGFVGLKGDAVNAAKKRVGQALARHTG